MGERRRRSAVGGRRSAVESHVLPGDNLWTIAADELTRQTGRTPDHLADVEIRNYWLTVIEANRAHLRSGDPNLIYPGESILCPPVT